MQLEVCTQTLANSFWWGLEVVVFVVFGDNKISR